MLLSSLINSCDFSEFQTFNNEFLNCNLTLQVGDLQFLLVLFTFFSLFLKDKTWNMHIHLEIYCMITYQHTEAKAKSLSSYRGCLYMHFLWRKLYLQIFTELCFKVFIWLWFNVDLENGSTLNKQQDSNLIMIPFTNTYMSQWVNTCWLRQNGC